LPASKLIKKENRKNRKRERKMMEVQKWEYGRKDIGVALLQECVFPAIWKIILECKLTSQKPNWYLLGDFQI